MDTQRLSFTGGDIRACEQHYGEISMASERGLKHFEGSFETFALNQNMSFLIISD